MKRFVWLVVLAVVVGCAPAERAVSTPPAGSTPDAPYEVLTLAGVAGPLSFPRQIAQGDVMEALLVGVLAEVDGCVRVTTEAGDQSYLPVWPPGFTLEGTDGTLAVSDPEGQPLALLGDLVSLSGGEATGGEPAAAALSCPGPYWIVGAEVGPYVP